LCTDGRTAAGLARSLVKSRCKRTMRYRPGRFFNVYMETCPVFCKLQYVSYDCTYKRSYEGLRLINRCKTWKDRTALISGVSNHHLADFTIGLKSDFFLCRAVLIQWPRFSIHSNDLFSVDCVPVLRSGLFFSSPLFFLFPPAP
jgi:hypothetical protein